MWGIEWRRWMIKDFSICMMILILLRRLYTQFFFLYRLIRRYARREKTFLFLNFKTLRNPSHLRNTQKHWNYHFLFVAPFLNRTLLFIFWLGNLFSQSVLRCNFFHSQKTHPNSQEFSESIEKRYPRLNFYSSTILNYNSS